MLEMIKLIKKIEIAIRNKKFQDQVRITFKNGKNKKSKIKLLITIIYLHHDSIIKSLNLYSLDR